MVKAEELRIGNWIKSIHTGATQVSLFMMGEFADDETYLDHLIPIPLTPEILIACGFSGHSRTVSFGTSAFYPNEYWYIVDGYDEFSGGTFKQPKQKHGFVIGTYKNGNSFYYPSNGHKTKGTEIKYAHQLQNLYYALTNTELNIQL